MHKLTLKTNELILELSYSIYYRLCMLGNMKSEISECFGGCLGLGTPPVSVWEHGVPKPKQPYKLIECCSITLCIFNFGDME